MKTKSNEPLIRIVRRSDVPQKQRYLIRFAAILAALVFCGIITAITTKINPFEVYKTIVVGAFGSSRKAWITFQDTSILFVRSEAWIHQFMIS